jgi:signal transduction histidine kinase
MGDSIDSLLQLSRLSRQEMDIHDVDLSRLAEEVAESLRVGPERDVDVTAPETRRGTPPAGIASRTS